MFGRVFSLLNVFSSEEKNSPPEKNNNSSLKSKESLTASPAQIDSQCVLPDNQSGKNTTNPSLQTNLQFSEDDVKNVLQDFEKLDFKNSNECFNEIAEDYEKKEKIDLFNYVILNKQKEIINILDQNLVNLKKTNSQAYFERQEEFRKKYGRYILKVDEGMNYGKDFQNKLQFFENQAEKVLSDFKKLKFDLIDDKCEDSSDSINYNSGRPANPFDKIANYYRAEKNIFLFNYVVLSKQKEIMDILENVHKGPQERFKLRFGRYLLRAEEGMDYAKELLKKEDIVGFFDGCYWPDKKAGRNVNHYDNLTINIKPEEHLETSRLFSEKTKRMEIIEYEVEKVKICSNDKTIVTIEKNDKQQRNYRFAKDAICNMKIEWSVEDEKGNFVNCFISLNVNSGEIEIEKATINGEDIRLEKILELAKQNKDMLIENQALYEFLEGYLEQDVQSQKEEIVTLGATVPVPSVSFSFEPGELEAGCIGGAYDHYPPRPRLDEPSAEEKSNSEYRSYDRFR